YIELLRSDIRAHKLTVMTQVMDLTEEEGNKFWPIYREYQQELTKLGDKKQELIRDYTTHYEELTDAKAHQLAVAEFEIESQQLALKKKYFERFEHALSSR